VCLLKKNKRYENHFKLSRQVTPKNIISGIIAFLFKHILTFKLIYF